jgi:hypothetical protein
MRISKYPCFFGTEVMEKIRTQLAHAGILQDTYGPVTQSIAHLKAYVLDDKP